MLLEFAGEIKVNEIEFLNGLNDYLNWFFIVKCIYLILKMAKFRLNT